VLEPLGSGWRLGSCRVRRLARGSFAHAGAGDVGLSYDLQRVELTDWHMWWKRRGGGGVRRLLMEDWDPIGVEGIPEAADEYDSYVGVVGQMLRDGATPDEVEG
jgi:hypothetical protein